MLGDTNVKCQEDVLAVSDIPPLQTETQIFQSVSEGTGDESFAIVEDYLGPGIYQRAGGFVGRCISVGKTLPEVHRQNLKTYGIPATQIAEELGNSRAANTVMLGLWTAIIGAVSKAAMQRSVADAVPPKTVEVNLNAFEAGYKKGLLYQDSDA